MINGRSIATFYGLTKPGIVRANVITAIAGYVFAAGNEIHARNIFGVIAGTWLVVASGCVFNNIIDIDIDQTMKRTRKRALPSNQVTRRQAMVFATILGISGVSVLVAFTNIATTLIGIIGFISYVGIYTYAKRRTMYATEIGTVPGATAMVAGYTTYTGSLDEIAFMLFLLMVTWQIPHFYGIALMRQKDYQKARIPTVVTRMGTAKTQIISVLYIGLIIVVGLSLFIQANLTPIFAYGVVSVGLFWLLVAYQARSDKPPVWGKKTFLGSLLSLLIICILLGIEGLIKSF